MYAYGPVPSRRLGRSIGVSPIPPKTCSYSCVYCQLGRTSHLQIKRESFFPKEDIWNDIQKVSVDSDADIITIVGDGEPTLNKDIGWIINKIKAELNLPVAVITNGSLLYLEDVQNDLMNADIILPSFDAANEELFKRINRPHKNLNFEIVKKGIIDFTHKFKGQVWAQVMLVKDLNDDSASMIAINEYLQQARVDRVYITTPVRPPAENWAVPPDPSKVIEAQKLLGGATGIINRETGEFGLQGFDNAADAIIELSSRHPLRKEQAFKIEKHFAENGIVEKLINSKELVDYPYQGEVYLLPSKFMRDNS